MNKKFGIAAIIAGVIIVAVLVFTYGNSSSPNPVTQNPQPNIPNSTTANPPAITGRHFFAGVNETMTIRTTQ